MKNKTCGECRYFKQEEEICSHNQKHYWSKAEFEACTGFEPKVITNGDKIIAGGMRAIAEFQQHLSCTNCVYFSIQMAGQEFCHKPDDKTCTDGIEAWLNAPAESEVKHG